MPRTVGLLQNMCRQVIYELFLPLTGKNISWKMRYTKEHFEAENLKKKRILNFMKILLVFIKRHRGTVWNSNAIEYWQSKGKSVNKLGQKLSNISINTGLDLKTRFTQILMKELVVFWLMSVKSSTVGCLSKCCCQCTSQLLTKDSEYS